MGVLISPIIFIKYRGMPKYSSIYATVRCVIGRVLSPMKKNVLSCILNGFSSDIIVHTMY